MRHVPLAMVCGLAGVLSLACADRCEAQFYAYSTSPTIVTAQSGGFAAYSGSPGNYYYGRHHHHRHHWGHHGQGFVREVLLPGAVQLINQQLGGQNPPADSAPAEPPVEWAVPQATFVEQEAAACKHTQDTLAVLVDLRKHFPEFPFKSAIKCECTVPPGDVTLPDGTITDVDVPAGVQP